MEEDKNVLGSIKENQETNKSRNREIYREKETELIRIGIINGRNGNREKEVR